MGFYIFRYWGDIVEPRDIFKIMNEILENIDEGVHFVNKDGKTIIYNNSVQKWKNEQTRYFNQFIFDIVNKMKINRSTLLEVLEKGKLSKTIFKNIWIKMEER